MHRNVPILNQAESAPTKTTMSSLSELESELAFQHEFVGACNEMLEVDPNDEGTKTDKADALAQIESLEAQIAAVNKSSDALAPPPPAAADHDAIPQPPKYDMSKHPKFRKQSPEAATVPPESVQTVFNVKDTVLARFSEDRQWYKAVITSKTGSPNDPVYTVTFKEYGNQETKRKNEIRPVHVENKKRKADGSPAVSLPATPATTASPAPKSVQNGAVISAAPAIDTSLVPKREPSKVSDGPTRMAPEPKKLKSSKKLDTNKASWQAFSASGPKKGPGATAKTTPHTSMFKTPDNPNAKVGFIGSGKPMQKDQSKAKWKYGGEAD